MDTIRRGATLLTTDRRDITAEEKAALQPDTILRTIRAAYKRGDDCLEDMKEWGAEAFAKANGWRWDPNGLFLPEHLGGIGNVYHGGRNWQFLDHPLYFRAPRTDGKKGWVNRAVVSQPYYLEEKELEELRQSRYGVAMPPVPRASFHLPGACFFIVVTASPEEIVWLPEQCDRSAIAEWIVPDKS
jgi:hypothetical protein